MDKDKDIQRLIDLFMAGQTSVEEERRLSDYLRTHTVPEEWRAYKEMFRYFDDGMPEGRYEEKDGRRTTQWRIAWTTIAAAAAIALLFVMTWKSGENRTIQSEQSPQMAVLAADSATVNSSDSTFKQVDKPVTTTKKRKTNKYRYRIAPPKTYYAEVQKGVAAIAEDSIRRNEQLLEADLRKAELREELVLRKLELMEMAHNMEIALATYDTANEDEGMEETY